MRLIHLPVSQRPVSHLLTEKKKGAILKAIAKHDSSTWKKLTQSWPNAHSNLVSPIYLFFPLGDQAQMNYSQYLHGWFPTDSIPHTGPLTFLLAEFVKWMSRQLCAAKDCSVAVFDIIYIYKNISFGKHQDTHTHTHIVCIYISIYISFLKRLCLARVS